MTRNETFSSRWLMILTMLGMAVGTGNIWRFPRIAAQNGGGEFLVAWIVFLLLWSVPLIMVEFGVGRRTRGGPIKAFIGMMGPKYAWMGAFIAFVATAILFYYSVVTGWTIRYVVASISGELPGDTPGQLWTSFTTSWWPVVTHGIAIGLGAAVVSRGIGTIEKVARVLMPALLLMVAVLAIRAVTLPGAGAGLDYLFTVDWSALTQPRIWVEALTQNAWDTGAGWGLVLCYAAYMRSQEDTTLNAVIVPAANNLISLVAGVMVLCTVFAVVPGLVAEFQNNPDTLAAFPALAAGLADGQTLSPELMQSTIFGAGNEGLTFIWIPELFATMPGGRTFMIAFFVALSFAAFSSLIAMIELATRVFIDAGMSRAKAIKLVAVGGFLLGMPSAINLGFLHNQDWVWAVALMVSGLFLAIAVIKYGADRFRQEQLNHEDSDLHIGRWWVFVIAVLVPIEAIGLAGWLLYNASKVDGWLNPISEYNVGTVIVQFAVVLTGLLLANRWIAGKTMAADA